MTRDDGPDIKAPDEQEDLASVAARIEARADDLARRFDRSDWIELGAAIVLALATVMAACNARVFNLRIVLSPWVDWR